MHVCLYHSPGLISAFIRWQSRSPYSHASLLFSDGVVIESKEFKGVHSLPKLDPPKGSRVQLYKVNCTPRQEHAVRSFMQSQDGKGYDYLAVLRFISRTPVEHWQKHRWFCSEIVFYALRLAGILLLINVEPWEVSPEILSLSPLLHYDRSLIT